jgi:hypothetical protein
MAYEPKDMTGSLFGNEKREKDTHPHAKGTALIDGKEYWVDAWTNTTQNGKRYQSLKFKLKDQQGERWGGIADAPVAPPAADLDDEIPF